MVNNLAAAQTSGSAAAGATSAKHNPSSLGTSRCDVVTGSDAVRVNCTITSITSPSTTVCSNEEKELPDYYFSRNNSDWIAAPKTLDIQQTVLHDGNDYYIAANVSWTASKVDRFEQAIGYDIRLFRIGGRRQCFTIVFDEQWPQLDDKHYPVTISLQTEGLLALNSEYYIEVNPLPRPIYIFNSKEYVARVMVQTPNIPGEETVENYRCAKGHPMGRLYNVAIKQVVPQPFDKAIHVWFYAAPPEYCFEKYRVELLHSHPGSVLKQPVNDVHPVEVLRQTLKLELVNNETRYVGEATISMVEPGRYDISVQPVALTINRRTGEPMCVCSGNTSGDDADLGGSLCSCYATTLPGIQLTDPGSISQRGSEFSYGNTPYSHQSKHTTGYRNTRRQLRQLDRTSWDSSVMVATYVFSALTLILLIVLLLFYRHKRKGKKTTRTAVSNGVFVLQSGCDTEMSQIDPSVCPLIDVPVEPNGKTERKILLVYAHDCFEHENCARALGDWICAHSDRVILVADWLSRESISANKFDWTYQAVSTADVVIVVASQAAWILYHSKLQQIAPVDTTVVAGLGSMVVARKQPSDLDDLFLLQLDLITERFRRRDLSPARLFTVYFDYTGSQYIFWHLSPYVRYEVPRHLRELHDGLFGKVQQNSGEESERETAITTVDQTESVVTPAAAEEKLLLAGDFEVDEDEDCSNCCGHCRVAEKALLEKIADMQIKTELQPNWFADTFAMKKTPPQIGEARPPLEVVEPEKNTQDVVNNSRVFACGSSVGDSALDAQESSITSAEVSAEPVVQQQPNNNVSYLNAPQQLNVKPGERPSDSGFVDEKAKAAYKHQHDCGTSSVRSDGDDSLASVSDRQTDKPADSQANAEQQAQIISS